MWCSIFVVGCDVARCLFPEIKKHTSELNITIAFPPSHTFSKRNHVSVANVQGKECTTIGSCWKNVPWSRNERILPWSRSQHCSYVSSSCHELHSSPMKWIMTWRDVFAKIHDRIVSHSPHVLTSTGACILNATKMGVYDLTKGYVSDYTGWSRKDIRTNFGSAFVAGFFMTLTVSPADNLRTRLMNQPVSVFFG